MSAYDKLGSIAWAINKANDIQDAYDVYQATQSNDALLNVAAKFGELAGIGIPLWFADKILTKTGLDRVFDSLKTNKTFEQYLRDQATASNLRDLGLGTLAEWGLHELSNWLSENRLLDPIFDAVSDHFTAARGWLAPRRDPLVFDLDGDGIETVGLNPASPILFDHNADGVKTATGWVKPDDGFLVLDRNGNGVIDNGRELFGDATLKSNGQLASDGFDALADLDSNLDGTVDAADSAFGALRLWRDLNQDGASQAGELFTLASQGIAGIRVAQTENNQVLANRNQIADLGTFTKTDGTTGMLGQVADVNLANDTFRRQFSDTIPLTAATQPLPDMRGSGLVRDLREAANDGAWRKAA